MRPSTAILWWLSSAAPAVAGPSLVELGAGEDRARAMVASCRGEPSVCGGPQARLELARAYYTLVLASWVHGRPVEPVQVANVRLLSPDLYGRFPSAVRAVVGEPSGWLVEPDTPGKSGVTHRAARHEDVPAPALPPGEAEPEPLALAAGHLRSGDPAAAITELFPLCNVRQPRAQALLGMAFQEQGMPAAALLVLEELLTGPAGERYAPYVTPRFVQMAARIGSRRPLVEVVEVVGPERWADEVRSDAWLARGSAHHARGELEWALRAYRRIDRDDDAWLEGVYRTGRIHRQVGRPWSAVRSLRDVWDAQAPSDALADAVREAAAWEMAAILEDLGRPGEASATYEVLTLTASPLAVPAAVRSARAAHRDGDSDRARMLLRQVPSHELAPEAAELRARLAMVAGDRGTADRELDALLAALEPMDATLARLMKRPDSLRSAIDAQLRGSGEWQPAGASGSTSPGVGLPDALVARLATDVDLVALRNEVRALEHDRAKLSAQGWPEEVVAGFARKLEAREREVRALVDTALYHALSELRRELATLRERAWRLRGGVTYASTRPHR